MFFNRFFSAIYGAPTSGNIFGCVCIRVHRIAAGFTRKVFAFSVSHLSTSRTNLRGVSGIDDNKWYSGQLALICKHSAKLIKTPFMPQSFLFLAKFIGGLADSLQIFNRNTKAKGFRLRNNALTESMVDKSGCGTFAPGEPLQQFFRTARAFALDRATNLFFFQPILIYPFRRNVFAVGKSNNINHSEINPKKFFNVFNSFFWNFYGLQKKEFAASGNQIGLTLNEWKPVGAMAYKGDFQPAIDSPDRNRIVFVRENPGVKSYCSEWFKFSLDFLVKFVRIRHFRDTSNCHLGRKSRLLFNKIIGFLVQLELVECLFFPRYFRNSVAGRVCLLNGIKQGLCLTIVGQKLNLQYQLHIFNILLLFEVCKNYFKKGDAKIPPTVKTVGFLFA